MILLRIVIMMLFFANLYADFNLNPVKTNLIKVDGSYGYVKDSSEISLYSSGIVMHNFADSKSIVARASVISKENGLAKLEFKVFDSLEQKALPLPNILPEVNDEVILNFLYNRALIIAPNESIYNEIEQSFPQIYFTHIDIFGAQLIRDSVGSPKRSDFRKFCSNNAVGILIFALDQKAVFVDCQDFNILAENSISKATKIQTPFYSRVGSYKNKFLGFLTSDQDITNFYGYYKALLGIYK